MKTALLALLLLWPTPSPAAAPSLEGHHALHAPIVLVHGATMHGSRLQVGPWDLGDYFGGVSKFFSVSGTPVYVVELSTDSTIGERGAVLKNFLETDLKGHKVNVLAHSMGGLDARYAISILHSEQVASLTTIGTPHYGTPLAEWALEQIHSRGFWYQFFRFFGFDLAMRRFVPELSPKGMKIFNERVPDSASVRYFSVRTRAPARWNTMSALLWFPAHWLESQGGPLLAHGSDGMVPYDSQGWGKVIASSERMDHLAQMNHHELRLENVREESERIYVSIYENLEREGL